MKKLFILLAILVVGSAMIFAGGQSEKVTADIQEKQELSVLWFYDDPSELDFLNAAFAEYQKMHPNVSFKLNTVPYDSLNQKATQLVAGGTAPDVVKLTDVRPEIAPFILDLSKYIGGEDYLNKYIKGVAAAMKRDGKIIGLPLDVTANGLILNKYLFEKAGVAIPDKKDAWTWSEFLKKAAEVRDKTGVKYSLVWDVTPHRWLTYFFENGAQLFSDDQKGNAFNTQQSINAFQGFADMFKDGYMPLSTWGGAENPRDMFFSGQSVAWMSGSWQVKAMIEGLKDFEWTAGPNPYVETRSSVLGYKFVSSFSNAKYPATAADFIKFFTNAEMNAQYAKTLTTIPARTDTGTVDYGNPAATSALNNLGYELSISPLHASSDVTNPTMAYVWNPLKENIIDVILNKKSAKQAVSDVSKVIDDGLKATQQK